MPRRKSPTLTDAELPIMRVLWTLGRATVGEVLETLPTRKRPAYNTVLTILRILEQKRYVAHDRDGRAFVYRPLVLESQVRRRAVRLLVDRLFEHSPLLLMLNVLEDAQVPPEELARLKDLIARHE
jgi:predicted transcriptional regulator